MVSGRYKSILIDGSGNGYLKTGSDYVHLNPVRAGLNTQNRALTRLTTLWQHRAMPARPKTNSPSPAERSVHAGLKKAISYQ